MNTHIKQLVKKKNMPVIETVSLNPSQVYGTGHIRIKLVIPRLVKPSEELPVVVMMAETPGEQQVNHRWGCGLECYLVSSSNMVVAMVDVRGSAGQGSSWKQSIRGRLGVLEAQDMEQVVRFLTSLKYIDQSRIGVFGQAYGGFLALQAMLSNLPLLGSIKCGLTVAPVTHWVFSSSFTAERLMGMLDVKENWLNYEKISILGRQDLTSLANKRIRIVHGMADRKVLVENTMRFSQKLVEHNILFEQQV